MLSNSLNLFTFAWLAGWAVYASWSMAKGRVHSINFVTIVHFVYSGLPALLDVVVGLPDFRQAPGFYDATRDLPTLAITSFYVCLCPVIWTWAGRPPQRPGARPKDLAAFLHSPALRALAFCVCLAPLLFVLAAPQPELYFTYAVNLDEDFAAQEAVSTWNVYVNQAGLGCILASALLLLAPRAGLGTLLLVTPPLALVAYIQGKRSGVAVLLLLLLYVLWRWGALRGVRFYAMALVVVAALAGFSSWYQSEYRSHFVKEEDRYDWFRVDYSRDHLFKLAIYSELYPEKGKILEYRGQSFLFNLVFLVPRDVWPGKPYPYGVYPTARGFEIEPDYLGWALTTSILEESIANLGWFGLLAGPLILAWLCRTGDSTGNALIQLVTVLLGATLLSVQTSVMLPAIVAWLVLVGWARWGAQAPAPQARRLRAAPPRRAAVPLGGGYS
jgi:hypothetical protein